MNSQSDFRGPVHMKIRGKLFLMLFLPVLGMFGFSVYVLWEKWHVLDEMQTLGVLSDFSVSASNLTHELQKESGMSSGHVGSRGEKFGKDLDAQRTATDRKVVDFRSYVETHPEVGMFVQYAESLRETLAEIERLEAMRKSVSALGITDVDAINYYSGLNDALLRIVEDIATNSPDPAVGRIAQTRASFLQVKEHVGQERALLNGAFAAGRFAPGVHGKFLAVIAEQDTFTHVFFQGVLAGQLELLQRKMQDKSFEEMTRLRAIALQKAGNGNFGVDPNHWFDTSTRKIMLLKEMEDRLTDDMNAEIARLAGAARMTFMIVVAVTLVSLSAALAIAFVMLRGITRQIGTLHDTIGQIERDSDLSLRAQVNSSDEIGDTARALNAMLDKFHNSLSQVTDSTSRLAAAAEELSAVTEQTRKGVLKQQSETDQVAAAMNEMASTVQEVARNTAQAAGAARSADEKTRNGIDAVTHAIEMIDDLANEVRDAAKAVRKLEDDSSDIGKVVDVIRSIAEQTNLLALNAAIEAARAGEQGRGFAVVADEVRVLASRTQNSTQEIQAMIQRLQDGTKQAAQVMLRGNQQAKVCVREAGKGASMLAAISEGVGTINDMNPQIASAAEEQGAVAEEINRNIVSISQVTSQTADGSRQTAAASDELAQLAAQLHTLVAQFRL